jgi:hypothetical protein
LVRHPPPQRRRRLCTCQKGRDCSSPGKHPKTRAGVKDATIDKRTVIEWWKRWPTANIGIATGMVSGLLVLDIDPRHGGDDSLDALIDQHGPLPDTVEVTTGGSGRHIYFRHPDGHHVENSNGSLGQGLDVRSEGGYVVAPPSIHQSGGRYEWELSSHPDETPRAAPPHWLITSVRPGAKASAATSNENATPDRLNPAAILQGVPVGERNDTVFRYMSRLRGKGLAREEAVALGRIIVAACKQDAPFTEAEMMGCLESAWRYPVDPLPPGDDIAGTDRNPGFHIVHGDDIEHLPEPESLIDGVITKGSLAVLYGGSGTYKTFVALSMAGAVASGSPWLHRAVHQGHVVYVAAEGVGDLGQRHRAMREVLSLEALPGVSYVIEPVNLYTGDAQLGDADRLAAQIADLEPVFVVFDTLARSMAGGDENFAKDINAVIASADRLRHDTGATVLLIHHTGVDRTRGRGSTALKAAADTVIKQTSAGLDATLKCDKQKMAAPFDPITIPLAARADSLAVVHTGVAPALTDHEVAAARLVPDDGITHGDWKKAFTTANLGSERTFDRRRGDLEDKAIVEKRDTPDGARYFLTDEGLKALDATGAK